MSWPSAPATNGGFPCAITASVLTLNIRSRSLDSSSVSTASPIIPAPVWVWPFANGLSSAPAGGSGWNLSPEEVRRFHLPSRQRTTSKHDSKGKINSVLLVEDNPADAGL